MDKKQHWENVFATKQENEVSWFQPNPETSLHFFEKHQVPKSAKIIEIGGGDSYVIDELLEQGYQNLTLLDISENAINRIKKRLGNKAEKINFIVSDILDFKPEENYDIWHDRASFHFLTKPEEIAKYAEIVNHSTTENALLFIGTFSESGPLKCSGLEITQYSEEKFQDIFGENFTIKNWFTENHKTPFETTQNFIFCEFEKNNKSEK